MPDRFHSISLFPLFNAVQSKCFSTVYHTDTNLILSAPTGNGKTAVLEVAICRLVTRFQNDQFKIVYMAPTKSLCSKRQRDWHLKFGILSLRCAELTGDTDHATLKSIQSVDVIITTPEKWDSMTRKWRDHTKLMQLVKLFLIDEGNILKEKRGATLEAVVSRMKSMGSNVRFIALSATSGAHFQQCPTMDSWFCQLMVLPFLSLPSCTLHPLIPLLLYNIRVFFTFHRLGVATIIRLLWT